MTFKELNLIAPILQAVEEEGYTTPTPIQEQSIPIVLQGADLLGCAQTGTGKTAAFAIPILQLLSENRINEKKRRVRSLIVTPTRELAIQIDESFKAYGRHTSLKTAVIFGGVGQAPQVAQLRAGIDILVATPGRLLDLVNQNLLTLKDIEILVLDEADRMLDMGFIHDIRKILALLPQKRQSLFFSATMPPEIVKLSSTILHLPQKVEVTPVSSTAETVQQYIYFVDKGNKGALLVELLKDQKIKSVLVFTRTKHGADRLARILNKNHIKAEAIHGDKAQNSRQRALSNFKDQTTRVLVATDIAARGIDIDDMQFVVNYELPNIPETYVHRIGRTGRAGASGTAFSFCDAIEKEYLRDIEKLIKRKIPVVDNHPFPLVDHNPEPPAQRGAQRSAPRQQASRQQAPRQQAPRQQAAHQEAARPAKAAAAPRQPRNNDERPKTAGGQGPKNTSGTNKRRWFNKGFSKSKTTGA